MAMVIVVKMIVVMMMMMTRVMMMGFIATWHIVASHIIKLLLT